MWTSSNIIIIVFEYIDDHHMSELSTRNSSSKTTNNINNELCLPTFLHANQIRTVNTPFNRSSMFDRPYTDRVWHGIHTYIYIYCVVFFAFFCFMRRLDYCYWPPAARDYTFILVLFIRHCSFERNEEISNLLPTHTRPETKTTANFFYWTETLDE